MYLSKTKLLTLSLHDFLKYRIKYFFLFIILMLISSCNYKPLFNENRLSNLTFKSIETSGDKRIAQIMVNKLNIIKNQSGKNTLHIEANKNKDVSNKSSSGKVLEYSIALNYKIEAKEFLTGKVIYSKTISNSKNYKSSSLYSDTINSEKKIIENISNLVATQIINELNLILQNDI